MPATTARRPAADSVGYRQHALWLSQDELAELAEEMRSAITASRDQTAS